MTFTVLQESEVEHFTHNLNSMYENIKKNQNRTISLSRHVLKDDGSQDISESNPHCQYFNWDSNHHLEHK